MESNIKKVSNILRSLNWYLDYYIFKLSNKTVKIDHDKIKRVLIVELKLIGDILVTTPSIKAIKKRYPDSKITMMVPPRMEPIITNNPNINKIISIANEDIKSNFNEILTKIKDKYDLAVIFHPGSRLISKLIYKANIPYRIGCTKVGFIEGKGYNLTHKTHPTFELKHKVDDNLDVLKTIGINVEKEEDKYPELYIPQKDKVKIESLLNKKGFSKNDFLICIHTNPNHNSHRWIKERFTDLSDTLINKYKAKLIFTGTEDHIENIKEITKDLGNKNYLILAGKTNLKQYFEALRICSIVITVDTSAMLIAGAVKTPVITLYGAGNPRIWHPYCDNHIDIHKNEVCTSCMKHECFRKNERYMECMKSIMVKDVLDAVDNIQKTI